MLFKFFLVVHALVAAALVGVILMQRSEGGGLAGGGSSTGLVSVRGAADILTRMTAVLGALFVLLSIGLAGLATINRAPQDLDTSLNSSVPAIPGQAPAPAAGPAVPMADPQTPALSPQADTAKVQAVAQDTPKPKVATDEKSAKKDEGTKPVTQPKPESKAEAVVPSKPAEQPSAPTVPMAPAPQ